MLRTTLTALASCCLILGAPACASSRSSRSSGSSDRITSAEISASSANNAYEIVSRLRPNWLKRPSTGSISGVRSQVILVYLDGNRLGDIGALRTLSATGIRSMEWIDATRAATILPGIGSEALAGAISIRTQ